jgi:hypothetical protein
VPRAAAEAAAAAAAQAECVCISESLHPDQPHLSSQSSTSETVLNLSALLLSSSELKTQNKYLTAFFY